MPFRLTCEKRQPIPRRSARRSSWPSIWRTPSIPVVVRQNLEDTQAIKGKNVDLDQLAQVLASIRGVTLGLRVTTNVTGSLRIDFREDITMTADYAKPLILEKLGKFGAMIDEFYEWEVRVTKNTLFLSGTLSAKGLRRVLPVDRPAHS